MAANADGEGKEKVSLRQTTSQAVTPPALLRGEPFCMIEQCLVWIEKKFFGLDLDCKPLKSSPPTERVNLQTL